MSAVEAFLRAVDRAWRSPANARTRLRIIGSTALMLQADYTRGTKDSDVLETDALSKPTQESLLQIAGPGSVLHQRHKLYLDIVQNGLPFLPQTPSFHLLPELNGSLRQIEIEVLDIVDVVVSKLKRFSVHDQSDIAAMVDMGLVEHSRLIARLRSAVEVYSMDARGDDLPKYVRNLHRIERDLFGVPEADIELPAWIADE